MIPKLSEMTLEQKIGMVLCARRCGYPAEFEETLELIKKRAVGCVQIPLNAKTPEYVRRIREAADYPVLLINDMEKGNPLADYPLIPALTLAAVNNKEYVESFAKCIVSSAKKLGIDGIWGPVVDIHQVNGPGGCHRTFGDTPEKILNATEVINQYFTDHGFIGTSKHYPGGHDLPYDSHMVENVSYVSEEYLRNFTLVPYVELLKKGLLRAIMTSHTTHVNIDKEYPATLSKKILGIIREYGFDGVIFSDSLAMMGILQKYGEGPAMGIAFDAGVDIILPNYRTPISKCYEMMEENLKNGLFTEERLDEAVRRVLALMEFSEKHKDDIPEVTEKDTENLRNVTRDCITAITDEGIPAALGNNEKRRLFVIVTDNEFSADEPEMEITESRWYDPKSVAEKIKKEFPNSEVMFIPEFATASQNEKVLVTATKHDEVVFVTYCATACYLGTDCMTRRTEMLINCLIMSGKVSAVLHYGNPHAVEPLQHVKRVIFGYNANASLLPAIDVLAGNIEAKGTLPYKVDLQ
ncbi:MAG: hypothetical protein IJ946_04965 [Clostridia bacterium]|nr:hypothetical protein [Clostridia bacterium]